MKEPVFSFFFFFLCVSVNVCVCVVVRACACVRVCRGVGRGGGGCFVWEVLCVCPPPPTPTHKWVDHHRSVPYNVTSHFVPNCTLLYVCRESVFFFVFFFFFFLLTSSITKVWTITMPYRRDCISRVTHLLFCSFEKTNHGCGNTP